MGKQEQLIWFRSIIQRTRNGDNEAEQKLRDVITQVAADAPRDGLAKMGDFLVDVIWNDAEREAVREN